MKEESWKPIDSYYEASNLGRIRRTPSHPTKPKTLVKLTLGNRYLVARVLIDGQLKKRAVHLLVAKAFLGEEFAAIRHKDGCLTNNKPDNLQPMSQRAYREARGQSKGDGRVRLPKADYDMVWALRYRFSLSTTEIAKLVEVSQPTISRILASMNLGGKSFKARRKDRREDTISRVLARCKVKDCTCSCHLFFTAKEESPSDS